MESTDFIKREIPLCQLCKGQKRCRCIYYINPTEYWIGGIEYTYFFVGQREYAGMADTLNLIAAPDETSEVKREKEVNTLKMGLMRYVQKHLFRIH